MKHHDMKDKTRKEYQKDTEVKVRNVVWAIDSSSVALIRCGKGILKWREDDPTQLDRKAKTFLTMNRTYYSPAVTDRLYTKRPNKTCVEVISVKDCMHIELGNLLKY